MLAIEYILKLWKLWINTFCYTLVQLLHYILNCIHLEWRWLFGPFRYMLIQTVRLIVWIISIPDEELFSEAVVGCTASYFVKIIWLSRWFCNPPPPMLRLYIALFAVAEGWLLLDIGWFVLFLTYLFNYMMYIRTYHVFHHPPTFLKQSLWWNINITLLKLTSKTTLTWLSHLFWNSHIFVLLSLLLKYLPSSHVLSPLQVDDGKHLVVISPEPL